MQENGENVLNRTAPNSIEAEKAVIGSMLMDRDAAEAALSLLEKDDFYSRSYQVMFEAISSLYESGSAVDLVTVSEQLARDGAPAEMQTAQFLRDIYEYNAVSVNVRSYAQIVKDKASLRRLLKACGDISELCYEGSAEADEVLSTAESRIFEVLKTGAQSDIMGIDEISLNVFKKIQEASRNREHITGIATGFSDLDNMTTGFQPSDFILIAARPSMGKTAFALNILEYVAVKKNRPCMIFSLEMSREQLVNRLFAMDSGLDAQSLRSGRVGDNDWDLLIQTADRIGSSNIIIDDTPGINVAELRSRCRKVKLERGLDMVIVDYLQLMSGSSRRNSDNRQQEVSDISRALKALARDIECPVIAISQLSRAVESRADKRPMLSDLRDSGAIEQDADIVLFLYRDEYYNPDSEKKGEAEVIIAKQRNGPIGSIGLYWQAETTRFVSRERTYT